MTRLSPPPAPTDRDLRRTRLAAVLGWAYPKLGCPRRWRLARPLLSLIQRLEGGPCSSATARDLMRRYHGIDVGAYSYGACLSVGVWPPGVSVGRYVSVGYEARVYPQNHPLDRLSMHPFFYDARLGFVKTDALPPGSLRVEHDAWIGNHAIITHGCKRIGLGAVVGAGAVVTKDVPDFAIVAGNPAKVIRFRFDEQTRQRILESRWWEKPLEDLTAELTTMLEPVGSRPLPGEAAPQRLPAAAGDLQ